MCDYNDAIEANHQAAESADLSSSGGAVLKYHRRPDRRDARRRRLLRAGGRPRPGSRAAQRGRQSYLVQPFPLSPIRLPNHQITGLAADAPTPSATVLKRVRRDLAETTTSLIPDDHQRIGVDVATRTSSSTTRPPRRSRPPPTGPHRLGVAVPPWAGATMTRAVCPGARSLVSGAMCSWPPMRATRAPSSGHTDLGDLTRQPPPELTGQERDLGPDDPSTYPTPVLPARRWNSAGVRQRMGRARSGRSWST